MITTLLATVAMAGAFHGEPLNCPISGGKVGADAPYADFGGVRVMFCCNKCPAAFEANPTKMAEEARKKKLTFGVSLFDPVTGNRLVHDKAIKEFSDYNGVRYLFASTEDKTKFDADPKKYGSAPEKEALYCPVGNEEVKTYAESSGYVDYKGVRYYMCCAGCDSKMHKEPEKYVGNAAKHIRPVGIATEKKKS